MNSTLHTLVHYILLSICLILGFFLLVTFRTAYSLMLTPLAESNWRGNAWASILDKGLIFGGGLLFIVFLGVADFYLKKGSEQQMLWGRFARLIGVEILILLALHTSIAIMTGFSPQVLGLLGAELVIGLTAVGYSCRVLPPGKGRFSQRLQRFLKK